MVEMCVDKASALYRKACDGGNPYGCSNLGYLYDKEFSPRDPVKATALYDQACQAKLPLGCHNLGIQYRDGDGAAQDYAKALPLFDFACAGTEQYEAYLDGCVSAGYMYSNGIGVAQDYAKALGYYQPACDKGNGLSCNNLGYMYFKGNGVVQDKTKAKEYYRKACDLSHFAGLTPL